MRRPAWGNRLSPQAGRLPAAAGRGVLDATECQGVLTMRYRSTSDRTLLSWPIILALGTGIVAAALTILGSLFF
jgi:hypothetical protein